MEDTKVENSDAASTVSDKKRKETIESALREGTHNTSPWAWKLSGCAGNTWTRDLSLVLVFLRIFHKRLLYKAGETCFPHMGIRDWR
ncbi:hypothetical protein RhiXN_10186 [Rhizoctonia solani]|uniref:Uncharacterized protein n=1 Tax=Rhizoctonia solani TaxID=456999 RepID=A0A8H8T0N4_9AGAM|nr:uncharacterized protein RhiXN_10186 [Rhizoctonia solani]QRW23862.1 hypothetical protein RhiXN_10186 [Rhizoctonia solani]